MLKTIAGLLESRTIIATLTLGIVLFVPDVKNFLIQILPNGLENTPTLEAILLALIAYFRANPVAKL
jgi:hypothetical protein